MQSGISNLAAMNPCPWGYYNDPVKECTCSLTNVLRYQKRISGPLLDHIDIHIEVPRVDYEKLSGDRLGETSEKIRARVLSHAKRETGAHDCGPGGQRPDRNAALEAIQYRPRKQV